MNTIRILTQMTMAAITFFVMGSAHAESCAKVEVLSDACLPSSIKASLENCEDDLIGIQKPKCNGDEMIVTLRGKDSDYLVTLKKNSDAWGGWGVASEKEIDHRPTAKTLPKTEHELPTPPMASVEVSNPAAKPNEPKVESAFSFAAYFDAYYEYNFNRPKPNGDHSPQNNLHYYDWYSNQLGLNLAELTIKHTRKESSFVMDLDFGQFADINASTPAVTASGGPTYAPTTIDELSKHIGQAVFTYNPAGAPNWVFEVGKMATHLGLELGKSKDNWNYSRSTIFSFAIPLWHTGMHVGYTVKPNILTASAYLYNGWNTIYENNFTPTYGAQIKWTPNDRFTGVYNYIGGPEQALNSNNWKQVHEANFAYTLNPTVSLASDFVYGNEKAAVPSGDASWYGAQLGMKWQTSPKFYLSPRVEYYRDPQGYTLGGSDQLLYTYTLTESLQLSDGFELRVEQRLDHSNQGNRFIKRDGSTSDQPVVIVGMLYSM